MNYLFFSYVGGYQASITVPKFRNDGTKCTGAELCAARIVDGAWEFRIAECQQNENFWTVRANLSNRDDVFFIATQNQLEHQIMQSTLSDLNSFTDTTPAFRANLELKNDLGGHSSYQSEYPFRMVTRHGVMVSNIDMLQNKSAKSNLLLLRNIFHKPIRETYKGYIVHKPTKTVVQQVTLESNRTNVINLKDYECMDGLYFIADGYLGIPIFFSESEQGHLSLEHTHPPHEAVSHRAASRVGAFRNDLLSIIR